MTLGSPRRLSLALPTRGKPSAWLPLWDRDFTAMASADKGSAPGAITIGNDAAVILNPSSNFLKPTTGGVSLIAGQGLQLDTTGCTTGPADDLNHSTGAGVYWSMTAILAAALWPNTTPGPEVIWSEICLIGVMDLSDCASDGEGAAIAIAQATTFGTGTAARAVRVAGALNCNQGQHTGTYVGSSSTIAAVGMPAAPDSFAVVSAHTGGQSFWGISPGGIAFPTRWYTRDQYLASMATNNPLTVGGYIRATGVISFTVYDTGKTASKPRLKRLTLFGRNPALRLPTGGYTQISAAA